MKALIKQLHGVSLSEQVWVVVHHITAGISDLIQTVAGDPYI
jgi:hypothetical protein